MTPASSTNEVRLAILDPGHFHAALIQKDMYPGLSPRVAVYAPLSPELLDYLNRVSLFNARAQNPTAWQLDIHTGPDFLERLLRERAGNAVVIAGRNRGKIDRIQRSLEAGFHVIADKPWIIASADLPKLAAALDLADSKHLTAYDMMTERYEITSILQRELVNAPEVFGRTVSVKARSVHHLMKMVAGIPIRRPAWFFDIDEYGEALADVGTHVVDLVQWTAFPRDSIDYRNDVRILDGKRWPTVVSKAQFRQVTGENDFPVALERWIRNGALDYFANNSVYYAVRGIPVSLEILWNWEAPEGGGDIYEALFEGTKASVEIRQTAEQKYQPELYVKPASAALEAKLREIQNQWPGVSIAASGGEARIVIPDKYRVGHEAHFAQVTNRFFDYLRDPKSLPAWEKSNMLVKYFIATRGVEIAGR